MKASQKLGILRRQSCKFSRSKLENIYFCMIWPTLEYGCVILDNCSAANSLLLESIQWRAAVICTGALRRTESLKLETETGWESLSLRCTKAKLLLYFSFCSGSAPPYLQGNIQFARQPLHYTRSSEISDNFVKCVVEKTCRIDCYNKSFFPDCAARWNTLPSKIKVIDSFSQFKFIFCQHLVGDTIVNSENCSSYSSACYGWIGRLIIQFRLGLSPLRSDLYKFNILDNPFCPACGDSLETLKHYLIEWPSY